MKFSTDGRQLLVYLKPELIRALKQKALDEDTHLYLVLERLVEESKLTSRAEE